MATLQELKKRKSVNVTTKKDIEDTALNNLLSQIENNPKFSSILKTAKEKEVPKLGLLQRVGSALSILSPVNAVYETKYEGKKFLPEYTKDIIGKGKEVFTGVRRLGGEKEKISKDILVKEGLRDTPGKIDFADVAGFGLDILSDPGTWLGGLAGKGAAKATKFGVSKIAAGAEKILPKSITNAAVELGTAIKDTFTPSLTKATRAIDDVSRLTFDVPRASFRTQAQYDLAKKSFEENASQYSRMANKIKDDLVKFIKGTLNVQRDAIQPLDDMSKAAAKTLGRDNFSLLQDIQEGVQGVDPAFLKEGKAIADELSAITEGMYQRQIKAGLKIGKREKYTPRVTTKEFLEKANEAKSFLGKESPRIKTAVGHALEREFVSVTDDAGKTITGNYKKLGLEPLENGGFIDKAGKLYKENPLSISEANKWSMEKLGVKMFEDDPFKTTAKYVIDAERAIRAKKTLDSLKVFGKPSIATEATEGVLKGFGEGSQAIKPGTIIDGVKWIESSAPELKGYTFPEDLVKFIDKTSGIIKTDEGTSALLKYYDKIMSFWKGSVYGFFPSSFTTNGVGGAFHNFVYGVTPDKYVIAEKILNGADDVLKVKGGRTLKLSQVKKWADEYGVIGETGYLDVPENLSRLPGDSKISKILKSPQKVHGALENRLRTSLFAEALSRGKSPAEAAKDVIKMHFDYTPGGVSEFEQKVLKRVIPFYTFTRNIIPTTIESMLNQPWKYASVFKAQKATGMSPNDEDFQYLPKYLQQQITLHSKDGKAYAGFKLPFEEAFAIIEDPLRKAISSTAPIYKIPIEVVTGKNIFKDMDIKEDTSGTLYKNAPEILKDFLEYTEVKVPANEKTGREEFTRSFVNPFKRYAVESFPFTSRIWNTVFRVANGDTNVDKFQTIITSIKEYDVDTDKNKSIYEKHLLEELQDKLERLGGGYNYNKFILTEGEDKKSKTIVPIKK